MKKRILYVCLITVLGLNLMIGAQIYRANAAGKENVYQQVRAFHAGAGAGAAGLCGWREGDL